MKKINRVLLILAVLFGMRWLMAEDWPQWRGVHRDGTSAETKLLKEWPEGGPTLLWHVTDIGKGYSTPAIEANRLYLLSNVGLEDEFVKAFDAQNGKEIWSTRIGKVGLPDQQPNFPAARSTPTIDGDVLYALGSDGDLTCLEKLTGKIRWQKNVQNEFGGKPGRWAYAESPLIDGDKVICTPGGSEAALIALNKKSGAIIWKTPIPGSENDAGYASAVLATINGVKQYVTFMGAGVIGVNAETGELLWKTGYNKDAVPIVTPVIMDNMIYTSSRAGCTLVKISGSASKAKVDTVYTDNKLPNAIGGSVLVGDYLYGTNNKMLMCMEFVTGNVLWEDASIAPGSLCYADGMLYMHGENGDMVLFAATPDGYLEAGRFSPPDQPERTDRMAKVWPYPVIANGRLYFRDHDVLWCYALK